MNYLFFAFEIGSSLSSGERVRFAGWRREGASLQYFPSTQSSYLSYRPWQIGTSYSHSLQFLAEWLTQFWAFLTTLPLPLYSSPMSILYQVNSSSYALFVSHSKEVEEDEQRGEVSSILKNEVSKAKDQRSISPDIVFPDELVLLCSCIDSDEVLCIEVFLSLSSFSFSSSLVLLLLPLNRGETSFVVVGGEIGLENEVDGEENSSWPEVAGEAARVRSFFVLKYYLSLFSIFFIGWMKKIQLWFLHERLFNIFTPVSIIQFDSFIRLSWNGITNPCLPSNLSHHWQSPLSSPLQQFSLELQQQQDQVVEWKQDEEEEEEEERQGVIEEEEALREEERREKGRTEMDN